MKRQLWILVAHRAGARLFKADSKGHISFSKEWDFPRGHLRAQDINADRAGSTNSSGGFSHAALVKEQDPVNRESEKTALQLAAELDALQNQDHECRFALVAEPRFLGMLKKSLKTPTHNAVVHSFPEDFAKISNQSVCERLQEKLKEQTTTLLL